MMNLLFGKKFLVIGAGGLLGSHLIQGILAQGAQVIAADISYYDAGAPSFFGHRL